MAGSKIGEQSIKGRTLLHLLGPLDVRQEDRDDVLARPSPVIGAGTLDRSYPPASRVISTL